MKFSALWLSAGLLGLSVISAQAADWPKSEVDKVLAIAAESEANSGIASCVKQSGTDIQFDVQQIDINKDGTNELVISSSPAEFGKGATGCYGQSSQNQYLFISDGKGGWNKYFGWDIHSLEYHPRKTVAWPDIELTGPGFCFPVWRYYQGQYRLWKTCDDNGNQIFADISDVSNAVPRDADEQLRPIEMRADFHGAEFWHNDSLMVVDHQKGLIIYKKPKKSIARFVKPGDVLFRGKPWDQYDINRSISGTAYVFKKGCPPAAYDVHGGFTMSWQIIVLRGAAPIRKKSSCAIEKYSRETGNARLEFQSMID